MRSGKNKLFNALTHFLKLKEFRDKNINKLNSIRKITIGDSFHKVYQNYFREHVKSFISDKNRQAIFKRIAKSEVKIELNVQTDTMQQLNKALSAEQKWLKSGPF